MNNVISEKLIGKNIGPYQLEDALRPGKTGQTFRAVADKTLITVALKILHPQGGPSNEFQNQFFAELETLVSLEHNHIARVLNYGEDQNFHYQVTEWVNDGSLSTWLQRQTRDGARPDLRMALDFMRQASDGLAFAHRKGVVHGEIEPENILLQATAGGSYRIKLSDFAIARLVANASAQASNDDAGPVNSPKYISPEQCMGLEGDDRSDIYSFGVVMYHVFTGLVPFEVRNLGEAANKHVYDQPTPLRDIRPELRPDLEAIVMRCLRKMPVERPSAEEIRDTLQAILDDLFPSLSATRAFDRGERPRVTPIIPPPSGRSDAPRITVVDAQGQVLQVLELSGQPLTIGREVTNTLVLAADTVSRHHARVEFDGREVLITDLSSSNGSMLIGSAIENGRLPKLEPTVWAWLGVLQIGTYWLKLEQPSGAAGANRIAVALERDVLSLIPGQAMTLKVTLANLGTLVDHLELTVDGVPPHWIVPQDAPIQLNPNTQASALMTILVPRVSESRAGKYRVIVRAKSTELEDDAGGAANAVWTVQGFAQSTLAVRPNNLNAKRKAVFNTVIKNEGNIPVRYVISAEDQNTKLQFKFDETKPKLTFPPGAKGVVLKYFRLFTYPITMLVRSTVEGFLGPTMRRAQRYAQDLQDLTGASNEDNAKKRKQYLEPPRPSSEPIDLEPGESAPVKLRVWAAWRLIGRPVQRPFVVMADTLEMPETQVLANVIRAAVPKEAIGQMTHFGLIPYWVIWAIAIILALVLFLNMRKPNVELALLGNTPNVKQGFTIICSKTDAAVSATIGRKGGIKTQKLSFRNGKCGIESGTTFTEGFKESQGLLEPDTYTIVAYNRWNIFDWGKAQNDLLVTPIRPKSFPPSLNVSVGNNVAVRGANGGRFVLKCQARNASSFQMNTPSGTIEMKNQCNGFPFTLDQSGDVTVTAFGADDATPPNVTSSPLKLKVVAPKANVQLVVSPTQVTKGQGQEITLSWTTINAKNIRISTPDNDNYSDLENSGSQPIIEPSKGVGTYTYIIKAENDDGFTVTNRATLSVVDPPPLVVAPPIQRPPPRPTPPVATRPIPPTPAPRQPPPRQQPPRPSPEIPIAPPVTSDPGELWYMNFGTMRLWSKDNVLVGDVDDLISSKQNQFKLKLERKTEKLIKYLGLFSARNLTLNFRNSKTTVSGTSLAYGEWCGAKENVQFADGCSFAGDWNVKIVGITPANNCKLNLRRVNDNVYGQMCDGEGSLLIKGGSFSIPKFSDKQTVISDTVVDSHNKEVGSLRMDISHYDSNQFMGQMTTYNDKVQHVFCGWRDGNPIPPGCQ
jgi:serine/threonine protein kinase